MFDKIPPRENVEVLNRPDDTAIHHSTFSVMLRKLDGNIFEWNRASEHHYGWKRHEALGNVSHELLGTVFPCPLQEINRELMEHGFWEGELIHTLSNGSKVKVQSRWELKPSVAGEPSVVEVNSPIKPLRPETAYLSRPLSRSEQLLAVFVHYRIYWLLPLALGLLAFFGAVEFLESDWRVPLHE